MKTIINNSNKEVRSILKGKMLKLYPGQKIEINRKYNQVATAICNKMSRKGLLYARIEKTLKIYIVRIK